LIADFLQFLAAFFQTIPTLLPRFALAWIGSFVALVLVFSTAKSRVRERVTRMDEAVRFWAGGLRYRLRDDLTSDRTARTWFFRFWTNFASAPSLSMFSLLIPFYWWHREPIYHGGGPRAAKMGLRAALAFSRPVLRRFDAALVCHQALFQAQRPTARRQSVRLQS
jgi:hypothetical protein